ncbi:MAG: DUF167 domain-containing protein [Nanoarchaeota archaeon]|nr:DUF167 domain-containing protein [Nanoarchaeota archaeon]
MIISVKVKPHSGRQEVVKEAGGYVVFLKSVPEGGKANVELLRLLKKHFKKEVKIKSGMSGRKKLLEVLG